MIGLSAKNSANKKRWVLPNFSCCHSMA